MRLMFLHTTASVQIAFSPAHVISIRPIVWGDQETGAGLSLTDGHEAVVCETYEEACREWADALDGRDRVVEFADDDDANTPIPTGD